MSTRTSRYFKSRRQAIVDALNLTCHCHGCVNDDEGGEQEAVSCDALPSTQASNSTPTPQSTRSTLQEYAQLSQKASVETGLGVVYHALKPTGEPLEGATSGAEKEKETREVAVPLTDFRDDPRMDVVYEKLIELSRSRERSDWKNLITMSSKWPEMADGVFQRIEQKSAAEPDPGKKLEWMQFGKALFNVHKELERYDSMVVQFMSADRLEWDAIVAERRPEMTPEFFEHLQRLIAAGESEPEKQERLKTMSSALVSMVEMYDQATCDKKSLEYAKDAIQDILQADTMDDADHRIDELAASGGLDGAFLLSMAKMYMSVKESPYTKEETKDVMYHLYVKSKESASRMQPPEVRILKHLLSIDDPLVLKQAIFDAFIPGEVSSTSLDYLSTTPAALLETLDTVLTAYESHKGKHTFLGETSKVMNPDIIQKMRKLEAYVKKEFL